MIITYENPMGFLKNEAEITNIQVYRNFMQITLKGINHPAAINIQLDINEVARLVSAVANNVEPEKRS